MSPMLVVAYALTGHVDIDLTTEPLQYDPNGEPVYLKDIWPSREEIQKTINECLKQGDFEEVYDVIFDGSEDWQNLEVNLIRISNGIKTQLILKKRLSLKILVQIRSGNRYKGCPGIIVFRRFGNDRPHLACRLI